MRGDWAVRRPDLAPGGWPFEFANDNYPDVDDTAEVVLALAARRRSTTAGAADRGVAWSLGMQCERRRLGRVRRRQHEPRCRAKLPFCDFGEVIDPPSADVTAHVVEMLAHEGRADDRRARRGIEWLLREQERDGSWFGRWGANHVYGTGAVVPGARRRGLAGHDERPRARSSWLERVQNDDGGWGEDLRSYRDPALARPRRLDRVADGVGAARAARRGRDTAPAVERARRAGSSRRSAPTAAGTSRSSPAPASPATSTSTTTSTGRSSR